MHSGGRFDFVLCNAGVESMACVFVVVVVLV